MSNKFDELRKRQSEAVSGLKDTVEQLAANADELVEISNEVKRAIISDNLNY